MRRLDSVDLRLLGALADDPRASFVALADRLGLSRNTVYARMTRLEESGVFLHFDRRIDPEAVGYPLSAFLTVTVQQKELSRIVADLAAIPDVVQAHGLSGAADVLCLIVCPDIHRLFEVDATILAIDGVERTETALSMGELIPYRIQPLLERDHGLAAE